MGKSGSKSISFVLPVFNEYEHLEAAVIKCIGVLSRDFKQFEIILVDDGSIDGTGLIMDNLSKNYPNNIKVLHNIINLNVGISVQKGIAISNMEYIVHNAVDLPLNPEEIISILNGNEDFDILVLERKTYAGYSVWRFITSKLNRIFIKVLFPIASKNIIDFNFTQIYKKEIVKDVLPLAKSPAFTTTEMILRARYKGLKVKTVPTNYLPRIFGKGAFGKPHDIFWSLYDMVRFRFLLWNKGI